MKSFIYILSALLALQACNKKNSTPLTPYEPNQTISYTVIDKITNQPVDSAMVYFAYGNMTSETKYSGTDGKVSFTIPKGWVVNEVKISKSGYSYYSFSPNSANVVLNQTILLDHVAYLRIHVENVAPINVGDKVEVYYPKPVFVSYPPDVFHVSANTTYITKAQAGNMGLLYVAYSFTTLVNQATINLNAIGGDTTDVTINF